MFGNQLGEVVRQTVNARTRLAVMVIAGLAVAGATAAFGGWAYAPLTGWDTAAAVFSLWVWLTIIAPLDADRTRAWATREDPGRAATDLIVIIGAVASLSAVAIVLINASSAKGSAQDLFAALGLASVALSWFTVHTLFTLRYARLYHTGPDEAISFNQKEPPRYLDFAYLAFTIGMTFQVSDTDLQAPLIRATALRHALLSYLFGAVILATTINLVAGLASSSGG